jgi:ankyrin repeat protein
VLWWLKLIHARTGHNAEWADPEWTMLHEGGYGTGARWYLDIAVEHDNAELAEWCLSHGANPNAAPGRGRRNRQRPLYEEAMFRGHVAVADVLARYGAGRSTNARTPLQQLVADCLREDEAAMRSTLARHPEFLRAAEPLFAAARYNRSRAASLLLDLGTSPDVESESGERALHIAAYQDSVDVARLLIERGAAVDPVGRLYDNTPLGGAMHCGSKAMIALLAGVSRSEWEVMYAGRVDRLRALIEENPERARAAGDGETLLMGLPPADEAAALEAAKLLIANGADPDLRDPHGLTAADRAERNAMYEVAAYLRQCQRSAGG